MTNSNSSCRWQSRLACTAAAAVLALAWTARPATAADSPDAVPLMASEVSEMQMVHDSLRRAAQKGDVAGFREMYDPASLREATTDRAGNSQRLTSSWLTKHAHEWPNVDEWTYVDGSGVGKWARLTFRRAHREAGKRDGRWDYYFIVYRKVKGNWTLTRRAIATFDGDGSKGAAPRLERLAIVPPFQLPPRMMTAADAGTFSVRGAPAE